MTETRSPQGGVDVGGGAMGKAVLDFLQTVGRPAEAEMYLRLFRSFPRGRFAVVALSADVLSASLLALAEQLELLLELGLFPVLAVGFDEPVPPDDLEDFRRLLLESGVPVEVLPGGGVALIQQTLARSQVPIVHFAQVGTLGAEDLIELVVQLSPRKVVFLRAGGGVGPHGGAPFEIEPGHVLRTNRAGISALNVVRDMNLLLDSGLVTDDERKWLKLGEDILRTLALSAVSGCTVSYAAPWSLLRELLTVRGEGTLLKLGSVISEESVVQPDVQRRVEQVLAESFGRRVRPEFFARPMQLLLLEENDRGLALLESGVEAHYLSKFAVLPVARGEGLGQDLWWEMRKRASRLYWRSRPNNPINDWYRTVCDGMQRTERWRVFWCGIDPSAIPAVVSDALGRPEDFF